MLKPFVVLTLFIYLVPSNALAQSLEELRLKSKTKLNYLSDLTLDTNAQKTSTVDDNSGATYTFGLKYRFDSKSNLWFFARGSKRFSGEEIFGLLDTIIRYERTLGSYQKFNNRLRLSAVLPTNEDAHEATSFVGAVSAQLRSGRSLHKKVYLNILNNIRWNLHEFRVSEQAGPNIQATIGTTAVVTYTLNRKIILSSSAGLLLAKTYKNKTRNRYNINLSGTYNMTDRMSFTLGGGTNASPTKADGQSSNIRLFDERDTSYYASLSYFY